MAIRDHELRYKIGLIVSSLIIASLILTSEFVKNILNNLGEYGYIGTLIASSFYSDVFTVGPSAAILLLLSPTQNIFIFSTLGAFGAMFSDYVLFKIFGKTIGKSMVRLNGRIALKKHTLHIVRKLGPIVAFFIILSPLPDELGLSILSILKYPDRKVLVLSFAANWLGIFLIGLAGRAIA
ncbi:MAG: hypothetical protein HY438_03790 [DPANN group archaeon]|nr:hypothetical protein [DPANN group archaeon]